MHALFISLDWRDYLSSRLNHSKNRFLPKRALFLEEGYMGLSLFSRSSYATLGAIHSTKLSGNFGPKLNGSVRSNRKSFEKTGPPFEVVLFSRSDRLEFWLNGSRPLCNLESQDLVQISNVASRFFFFLTETEKITSLQIIAVFFKNYGLN